MTTSVATLTSLRDRLETALVDSANAIWDTATLDEALRRALHAISHAWGEPLTLSGLDSALVTTLQAEDESTMITGGEFYAVLSRALDRMEVPNLNEDTPDRFFTWSDDAGKRFSSKLECVRLRRMQRSAAAPAAVTTWDESEPTW